MPGFYNNETGRYEDVEWLEKGIWLEDQEGFLYIIPNEEYGSAEIEGPDNVLLDTLNDICREDRLPNEQELTVLGLVEIPEHLKRFDSHDGYYHA